MIRKLLLAAFLVAGFTSGALAQNVQCPDRPASSNDNSCANTRWVKANAGGGGGSPGGTNGQVQYNNAGSFGGFTASGDATINTSTGAVTVTKSNGVAFGTAAFATTGTSGHTIPYLDGTNAWTGTQSFSGVVLSSITGSVQCLHVNSSGAVSGTGSDCGSGGGGGTPGGTNGQIQYNNGGVFGGLTATSVNIVDYGAIPSDNTKAAINQTAIQNALATGNPVYCPAGQTFYTQPVTVPTNGSKVIYGGCSLIAAGSATSPALGVLYGDGNTDFTVREISVDGSPLTIAGVLFVNNTGLTIQSINANGANAISVVSSVGTVIEKNTVPTYSNIGITCADCVTTKILHNSVTNVVGGTPSAAPFYCIQANMLTSSSPGSDLTISGNIIYGCGTSFGINVNGNGGKQYDGITISDNQVTDTTVEAINLAVVQNFTVSGNIAKFITSTSNDQGIDVWGPASEPSKNGLFVGNTIINACAGGIALDQNVSGVTITGNTIINAAKCKSTAGNANAAIILWNGQHNSVFGNTIVDPNNNMQWAVNEYNDGVVPAPDFNVIGENATTNGTLGRYNLVGTNSTFGEGCVYKKGTATCNGDPTTQTPTYSGVTLKGSSSGSATINAPSTGGGTATLFAGNDTIAGISATQTITNKSISGSSNTFSNMTTVTPILGGGSGSITAGNTGYVGIGAICASESPCLLIPSVSGTFSNLTIGFQGVPGGTATYTVTLRINFVDTALTCTVTSAVSICTDTSHSVAFSNGQIASLKIVSSSGAATVTSASFGLKYTTISP